MAKMKKPTAKPMTFKGTGGNMAKGYNGPMGVAGAKGSGSQHITATKPGKSGKSAKPKMDMC